MNLWLSVCSCSKQKSPYKPQNSWQLKCYCQGKPGWALTANNLSGISIVTSSHPIKTSFVCQVLLFRGAQESLVVPIFQSPRTFADFQSIIQYPQTKYSPKGNKMYCTKIHIFQKASRKKDRTHQHPKAILYNNALLISKASQGSLQNPLHTLWRCLEVCVLNTRTELT